jgi:hypothetical protein
VQTGAISEAQRAALSALKPAAERGFYLGGGTALCLRLAHRLSDDLDLFRSDAFDPDELLRELAAAGVAAEEPRSKPNSLLIDVDGVRTSFRHFPYPLLAAPDESLALPVASLQDLAAMKLESVASRGARKDFTDLYFILKSGRVSLNDTLQSFRLKFGVAKPDLLHRLKALTYFEDAETEPEPRLLRNIGWDEIKTFFENEVRSRWATFET